MLRALYSLLRLDHRRSRLRVAAVSCMIAMSGCSFGEQMSEATEQNSCQVDSDCATQHCQSGRCVTKSQEALNVRLVITPTRMPDGSAAFPIVSKPFALRGGEHAFMFTLPVSVPVRVFDSKEDREIPALVTFTPLDNESRLTLGTTQLTTVAPSADKPLPANDTLLLGDTEYTALIQPVDPQLPPHSLTFTAESGSELAVDYADIDWQTRTYLVRNLSGEAYNLRARVKGGGAVLSNTTRITSTSGPVTLVFDPIDAASYELELTPSEQRFYVAKDESPCGTLTPRPTLTVDASSLKRVVESWVVELPKLPEPVEYHAVVKSCVNAKLSGEMPVTLRTSSLIFDTSSASTLTTTALSPVTGKFETDTTASWDADLGGLTFCARVPPGDYTVVVTPTANLSCEIFAERRLLTPQANADAALSDQAPDELNLHTPAMLSGRVYTPDRMPMANATVNLVALHRSSSIALKEDDRSVLSWNRSRQALTTPDGTFALPVDLGSYDVIVKPPAQSNYAWRVLYDIDVGSRTVPFSTEVMLSAPVVITGKLRYEAGNARDQSSLASADVHAYTLVDEGKPSERSVEVARGQADASGNVTLLMPPQLQRSFIPE